jgi:hypothetical protein
MPISKRCIPAAVALILMAQGAQADWLDAVTDQVKQATADSGTQTSKTVASGLTDTQIGAGLREALDKGVKQAIGQLGKKDGFFDDKQVRIPMPSQLKMVETGLRKAGMGKYADAFVLAMNRAAEKAVPETAKVFSDTISNMSIADARKILGGTDHAATDYFRQNSGPALQTAILPIVKEYTQKADVTKYYKKMMAVYEQYGAPLVEQSGVNKYMGMIGGASDGSTFDAKDIDGYITQKGIDGLFTVIGDEEKKIRTEPAARTTDLLKKVFG